MKEYPYLNQFEKSDMHALLKTYEAYVTRANAARMPVIFVLVTIGISRFAGKAYLWLNICIILVLLGLIVWMISLVSKQLKQRKLVRQQLQGMCTESAFPYPEVRKSFNTLVRDTYKGPKI